MRDLGTGQGCGIDRRLVARLRADARLVRIGRVLAAPGCASRATALRVFGRATVASSLAQASGLDRALRTPPRRGTNTVVVGPARPLVQSRGLQLARGEAWVLRGSDALVRLRPGGWGAFVATRSQARFREWTVASTSQVHPHDIWPAGDGSVWYTAQFRGAAGLLDLATGAYHEIPLGPGSSPHGVIADSAGNAWITDQGLDAIVRVDRTTEAVSVYPVPIADSNPNTAVFDQGGVLWFTGAGGSYGRVDPATGQRRRLARRAGRRHRNFERPVRDHGHARRCRLVRLSARRLSRSRRSGHGGSHRHRPADAQRGYASRLVRLARALMGHRVLRLEARDVRPVQQALARVAHARRRHGRPHGSSLRRLRGCP